MVRPFIELRPQQDPISPSLDLIDRAAALFLRDGIAAVRMTDIADVSSMSVASIYRHFKTKTRLAILAGKHMWSRFNIELRSSLPEDELASASGAARLTMLFRAYCDAYLNHPDFVRFLDEFDHLIVAEQVPPEELASYGEAIDSFYPLFEAAYQDGLEDGSIAHAVDFPVFYRTVAHALMGIAQRTVRGSIIPSDELAEGSEELEYIVRMAQSTLGTK